jgi:iron complex outermembrane recepter protein
MNLKHLTTVLFLFFSYSVHAQSIRGRVYDTTTGISIDNAEISIEGTSYRAVSYSGGQYRLSVPSGPHIVIVSAKGYAKYRTSVRVGSVPYQLNVALGSQSRLSSQDVAVGSRDLSARIQTDSPIPIDNINVEQFATLNGQLDINQLLHFLLPSFNSNRQSGSDGADHVDPTSLRGLSTDQVLVLVNGKRRHQSPLVYIFGTRGRGNTSNDLNAIPIAAVERIEVLRDGASAQYGSDAIAGVINVVLKSESGLNLNASHNLYQTGDGLMQNYSLNYGKKISQNRGFFNLTADYLQRNRTIRTANETDYEVLPRKMFGDAQNHNSSLYFNTEVPLNDKNLFLYSFGGGQYRQTDANSYTYEADNTRNIKALYPDGFEPRIASNILDGTFSLGLLTRNLSGWNIDFSNTTGYNKLHYFVKNSLNASLGANSPKDFDAGGFGQSQNVTELTLTKKRIQNLKRTNFALGGEFRIENYNIFAGEEASWRKYPNPQDLPGTSQTFPGFKPTNVVDAYRTNFAAFADFEQDLHRNFMITLAGRFEDYSDFGTAINGKASARWKATPNVALRSSYSTGFRAPSLAQANFNVIYNDVNGDLIFEKLLAQNNSDVTKTLGVTALKQEQSNTLSFGTVISSDDNFRLTVDGYYVTVKDRIVLTGDFFGKDYPQIAATAKALDVQSISFFTNAINTRTFGIDAVATTITNLGSESKLETILAVNYNQMDVTRINTTAELLGREYSYFSDRDKSLLLASAPRWKAMFLAFYKMPNLTFSARVKGFSQVELSNRNINPITGLYRINTYKPKAIVDLSAQVYFTSSLSLTLGTSNIFNSYPTQQDPGYTETGGMYEAVQMGFGGRMFFTKLIFKLGE